MSRIDKLIADLCPDGVEFKPLGDIAKLVRGNGMPKSDLTENGVGAIHYGQIYTRYGAWARATISFVSEATAAKLAKVDPGDIIITNTSENIEDVGKAVAWVGDKQIVTGGHATVIKHAQDPKYLSYWFQSRAFFSQKRALATGTKVIDVSARQLEKVRIPIPPLEVQREIVRVLDKFTQLEAELEAELEARRRQYEHYRHRLLNAVEGATVEIGSLGVWRSGLTPSKSNPTYWESGNIPWLASMDVSNESSKEIRGRVTQIALEKTSLRLIPAPSLAVVFRSNILRRVLPIRLVDTDTTVNQDIRALVPSDLVDIEYAYQALRANSEQLRQNCVRTDGSMAAIDAKTFFSWKVPLPELAEQRLIARKLRRFDSLVNDLSIGLPAELAARRKQYEYYRDRLLTFEEKR